MTETYVFDTEAIIAYLYDEPGRDSVEAFLTAVNSGDANGLLAETNVAAVLHLVARFEGADETPTTASLRTADRDVRALEQWGLDLERADWRLAGEVKAEGHVSLADAHAVALAFERDATLVVGGDDDFDAPPLDIDVLRFRAEGV